MYFVTDEPMIFNTETGSVISITTTTTSEVMMGGYCLFRGSRKKCEDFIYSLAGWVGAVNPTVKKDGISMDVES